MRSFKRYLAENQDNFEFWPEQDFIDWFLGNGHRVLKKYNIEAPPTGFYDGIVIENGIANAKLITLSSEQTCLPRIGNTNLRHLPFQFGHIDRHFFMTDCDLGSLKGAPKTVGGKFSISNNKSITTFEHLPAAATSYILRGTGIKSFSGIHKVIKQFNANQALDAGTIVIPNTTEKALLGLLKIPGFKQVRTSGNDTSINAKLDEACEIITKHAQDEKNIIACQEELFKNDLDQYAKL